MRELKIAGGTDLKVRTATKLENQGCSHMPYFASCALQELEVVGLLYF